MPDEQSQTDAINTYLQFTPLASAAPVRSVVDSFVVPKATPTAIHDGRITDHTTIDCQHVFPQVLRHAHDSRGQMYSFRSAFSQHSNSSSHSLLDSSVVELLRAYQKQRSIKNPSSDEREHGSLVGSVLQTGSRPTSSPHQASSTETRTIPTLSSTVRQMAYAVEIVSPQSSQLQMAGQNSPTKRHSSVIDCPMTPGKSKKARRSEHSTPVKASLSQPYENGALVSNLLTQRAALLEQAQSFLDDIFEAEDNLEKDSSDNHIVTSNISFIEDNSEKCLSLETSQKLYVMLRKILAAKSIHSIDKEHTQRLQKILSRALKICDAAGLKDLEEGLDDETVQQQWLSAVLGASNSIVSSLCSICVLESFPNEQELSSEESFLLIVDCLKSVLEDLFFRWFSEGQNTNLARIECHKKLLDSLLQSCVSLVHRLAEVIEILEVTENIVSRVIFMAVAIIFVETPGRHNRICSHLLVEALKTSAVSILQRIFAKFQDQRQFILDEVLSCLDKLPVNRQTARQFKLGDGKNIQLVSALLLHLVHSSSVMTLDTHKLSKKTAEPRDSAEPVRDDVDDDGKAALDMPDELRVYIRRYATAEQVGRHIIDFLLGRSMKSNKAMSTEDAPFKVLLDVFIEDFVTVLHLPEWPAAELMLRWIANSMLMMVDNPKIGAQIKVSAVDALCSIACKVKASTIVIEEPLSPILGAARMLFEAMPVFEISEKTTVEELSGLQEVLAIVVMHLTKCAEDDPTYRVSCEFSITNWVNFLIRSSRDMNSKRPSQSPVLNAALDVVKAHGIPEKSGWDTRFEQPIADPIVVRAHIHLTSFSGLLHMTDAILPRLLTMMGHPQITLRTKTLRSFARLSEVDSSVLSLRPVQSQIALRISDHSPQVRDVAIDLLGKHITANPESGRQYYSILRDRLKDTGLSVRKRVLKLCKELYTKTQDTKLRTDIALQFLQRLQDEEDSVQELALKSFEIMWFGPLNPDQTEIRAISSPLTLRESKEVQTRTFVIRALASDPNEHVVDLLRKLFIRLEENVPSCKTDLRTSFNLIAQSFVTEVITSSEDEFRIQNLVALKVLAQASPDSFSPSHMESLLPYLQYGQSKFEQSAPMHVASVYVAVLPRLGSKSPSFLGEVQSSLLAQLTKLPLKTLSEAVPCLCIVVQLKGDFQRVATTLKSCLQRIKGLPKPANCGPTHEKQAILLLHLVGLFGRYLKLQTGSTLVQTFDIRDTVQLVDNLVPVVLSFCHDGSSRAATLVEKTALRSLGNICIMHPGCFQARNVLSMTDNLLAGNHTDLKKILLGIYTEYLINEQEINDSKTRAQNTNSEHKTATKKKIKKGEVAQIDVDVLTGNTDKFATDGISPSLMQRYLARILQFSLDSDLSLAMAATVLISNIVNQGLANPRNCMPTIIALESSKDPRLRDTAAKMHRNLYEKHESLIESCYIDGVKAAFCYWLKTTSYASFQDNVASIGVLYSIVRASRKGRQKFLTTFAKGLDTNLGKFKSLQDEDIMYCFFVAQNAACLEYATNEEVHLVIYSIDKILSMTGSSFLQLLEEHSELDQLGVAATILCISIKLREKLLSSYGITEAKCAAFEPSKLGSRADLKPALRKPGATSSPDWVVLHASARDRIEMFKQLFDKEEYQATSEHESGNASVNEDQIDDRAFAEMSKIIGTLENGNGQN